MPTDQKERDTFSQRLRLSLKAAGVNCDSPTELLRGFNKHHKGNDVTLHAVFKWLRAESIPTQDKVRTLAKWLGVSPVWLRYGDAEVSKIGKDGKSLELLEVEIELIKEYRQLNVAHREAIHEILKTLRRIEKK